MKYLIQKRIYLPQAIILALTSGAFSAVAVDADTVSDNGKTVAMKTTWTGKAVGSFTDRGDDNYRVGYFAKDGKMLAEYSLLTDKSTPVDMLDVDIDANGDAFSAIIAHGAQTALTVTGEIDASGNDKGENGSDFSGLGAMIVASEGANVNVDNMKIHTEGFVRSAFIVADEAKLSVKNSTVVTDGANPLTHVYDGYQNNANISKMVSPPWVLGIQGGVRSANMLGNQPTMNVINSQVTAGGWGVLSIDGSQSPVMNVVDSDLHIKTHAEGGMSAGNFSYSEQYGSGYGTYVIGNATQNFYGVNISGATYATIFTGGKANFASSNGDITLKDAKGNETETVTGKGRPSKIDAVWGFMSHRDGVLNVTDGTEINSAEATFLYKSGNLNIHFDDAKLNTQSGILLQMMDNDDSIVGANNAVFNTEFNEKAGWPSENGNITSKMPKSEAQTAQNGGVGEHGANAKCQPPQGTPPEGAPPQGIPPQGNPPAGEPPEGFPEGCKPPQMAEQNNPDSNTDNANTEEGTVVGADGQPLTAHKMGGQNSANVTFSNGDYHGNIYNGTGYYGQTAVPMSVTIGENATLNGTITLSETRHIDEKGEQNTYFTLNEYYDLGHVENRNFRNVDATASVTVTGGTWIVTGESLLTDLTLKAGKIVGNDGKNVSMTIDGKATEIKPGSYTGDIVISLK